MTAEVGGGPDRAAIVETQIRYAQACDRKDWALFDQVFTVDAIGWYGGRPVEGRAAIVAMIKIGLGATGATQHLLGNPVVDVAGDTATASCAVRAFHQGAGSKEHLTYEVFGEYEDELVRTDEGWRITRRRMAVTARVGAREVLGPLDIRD